MRAGDVEDKRAIGRIPGNDPLPQRPAFKCLLAILQAEHRINRSAMTRHAFLFQDRPYVCHKINVAMGIRQRLGIQNIPVRWSGFRLFRRSRLARR